ncbi:enoyl-CoA hydratase/isomerase family protein [Haliea sp. E17]|uniref:enoyl-CoA hydratase/isomerase family protein n=1 Tax=Haliea sp. E17 TaxID=3401576 RepID=UPI003AADA292
MSDNLNRPPPEEIILYEKDPKTKIATITLNRPGHLNAPTIAARQRYAKLVQQANVDDEVKVLVIRGVGDNFGSGGDLPEQSELFSSNQDSSLLHEFEIPEEADVKYPPKDSYRYLSTLVHHYATTASGMRSLQEFKKISIVEAKGYCYGWHFYQAADADLVVCSDETLFGHSAWRYAGWAARMWQWALMMGLRKFQEMVFTGRPFTAKEMYECHFVNSVVPRDQLEAETHKYALACSRSRPTDTVMMQKTFFEVFKQNQGEYMGSVLAAWLESLLPMVKSDGELELGDDTFDKGLNNAVKDNDELFPEDWRLSKRSRKTVPDPEAEEITQLRSQLAAMQEQLKALEARLGS